MGKERTSSPSAAMCTSDKHNNRQCDGRAPLRSIAAQPVPASPEARLAQGATNTSGRLWPSPTKMSTRGNAGVAPVESFEMEDNTIGSGGTSWTLRVPWLRNKRPRRIRQDDENSSIQTAQSRSMATASAQKTGDPEAVYYGGYMNAESQGFADGKSGSIEVLGDGLVPASPTSSPTAHQQQPKPQRQSRSPSKRHKHSRRKSGHKASRRATPEMNQDLLPQHREAPKSPPVAATVAAKESGVTRHYFLSNTLGIEPKNNNKVFRNRSWISTSSRESDGGKGSRRKNGSEDDSLADFDEAEWTPQDSAYGAAIPVCGWVPKRLRQGIEATLIVLTALALVYCVVTTSISVSEGKGDGTYVSYNDTYSNSGANLEFDDDWYVENSQIQNDEDDYFSNGNSNDNRGG